MIPRTGKQLRDFLASNNLTQKEAGLLMGSFPERAAFKRAHYMVQQEVLAERQLFAILKMWWNVKKKRLNELNLPDREHVFMKARLFDEIRSFLERDI